MGVGLAFRAAVEFSSERLALADTHLDAEQLPACPATIRLAGAGTVIGPDERVTPYEPMKINTIVVLEMIKVLKTWREPLPTMRIGPQASMECHGDLESLLMIEEMVEVIGIFANINLNPVDLAIETVAAVITGHAAAGFEANIEGFVSRKNERFGLLDPTLTNLVAIQIQAQTTPFCDAVAIVGKFHPHLMAAGGD